MISCPSRSCRGGRVYGFVNRDIISRLASTFDGANPNHVPPSVRKRRSRNKPCSLSIRSFIQDRADAFAKRTRAFRTPEGQIRSMYQRAYADTGSTGGLARRWRICRSGKEGTVGPTGACHVGVQRVRIQWTDASGYVVENRNTLIVGIHGDDTPRISPPCRDRGVISWPAVGWGSVRWHWQIAVRRGEAAKPGLHFPGGPST